LIRSLIWHFWNSNLMKVLLNATYKTWSGSGTC
jgi:hypothetical protein